MRDNTSAIIWLESCCFLEVFHHLAPLFRLCNGLCKSVGEYLVGSNAAGVAAVSDSRPNSGFARGLSWATSCLHRPDGSLVLHSLSRKRSNRDTPLQANCSSGSGQRWGLWTRTNVWRFEGRRDREASSDQARVVQPVRLSPGAPSALKVPSIAMRTIVIEFVAYVIVQAQLPTSGWENLRRSASYRSNGRTRWSLNRRGRNSAQSSDRSDH